VNFGGGGGMREVVGCGDTDDAAAYYHSIHCAWELGRSGCGMV